MMIEFGAYYEDTFHNVSCGLSLGDTQEEAAAAMQELSTPYEMEQGNFATDAPGGVAWLEALTWKPCVFIDNEMYIPHA